jgi:hypothetical protein
MAWKAGSADRMAVIETLEGGITFAGPAGATVVDPKTHHATLDVHVAEVKDQGFPVLESLSQQPPADTQAVSDLSANPNENKQYVIDIRPFRLPDELRVRRPHHVLAELFRPDHHLGDRGWPRHAGGSGHRLHPPAEAHQLGRHAGRGESNLVLGVILVAAVLLLPKGILPTLSGLIRRRSER